MLISSNTAVNNNEPNFQLQLENSDTVYRYVIPTLSRAKMVKAQSTAKKEAATTKGVSVVAALSLEMMDMIFPNIKSLDGKSILEVLDEYNVSDEVQNTVVDKVIAIATGDSKDD